MSKSTFSERLNFIINERGIRQKDLCQQTGIGKSAMSQYLSGSFEPKQQKLHILASALGVSEAWLMGYDVPRERMPESGGTVSIMEVVALDNTMADAHIPMGAVVTVVSLESADNGVSAITAGSQGPVAPLPDPDALAMADGKIVCWSSAGESSAANAQNSAGTRSQSAASDMQLRYLHMGNGALIFTAGDPAVPPQVFSFSDLINGNLTIHGIVQKAVIIF